MASTQCHTALLIPLGGDWIGEGQMASGGKRAAKAATLTSTHSEAHFFRASKPGTLHYFLSGRSCCHPFSGQGLWHHFHV